MNVESNTSSIKNFQRLLADSKSRILTHFKVNESLTHIISLSVREHFKQIIFYVLKGHFSVYK